MNNIVLLVKECEQLVNITCKVCVSRCLGTEEIGNLLSSYQLASLSIQICFAKPFASLGIMYILQLLELILFNKIKWLVPAVFELLR